MDELRRAVEALDAAMAAWEQASPSETINILGMTAQERAALAVRRAERKVIIVARIATQGQEDTTMKQDTSTSTDARFILMRVSTPDAYRYDHNVEVEVVGPYRILKCPSGYLSRYQLGRFASGMETASPDVFDTLDDAKEEAFRATREGW